MSYLYFSWLLFEHFLLGYFVQKVTERSIVEKKENGFRIPF